jgi:riboflavin kinase/FMN adenylyltransferase
VSGIQLWSEGMPPLGRAVAALGVFDGVHIGHQDLVRDAVQLARTRGVEAVVVTFDRDPDQVVGPTTAAPQLLGLDDKLEALSELGADTILVMPFTAELAATAPLVFLDEVLLEAMTPEAVVVGYDFRFGHRAEGDVDTLVRYGAEHGFTVVAHELVRVGDEPVSSTRIRQMVAAGAVEDAARLLGRPHRVRGDVVRGRGVGAELDAPTANVAVGPYAALPADGVYAGWATVDGVTYAAGISVGLPPTFPEATDTLEAHLVDFHGDLYGRSVVHEFVGRIRDQRRFETPGDLAGQIAKDLADVRRMTDPSGGV